MRRYFTAALLVIATNVIALSEAGATLVGLDSIYGPRTIVRDTESGLDWLALPVTEGDPFLEVANAFGPGERFAGFRFATEGEFVGLTDFFSPTPVPLVGGFCTSCDFEKTQQFISLFQAGLTEEFLAGKLGLRLIVENGELLADATGLIIEARDVDQFVLFDVQRVTVIPEAMVGAFFLVRPAPEPMTVTLLAAALAGLALLRRIKPV